MSLKIRLARAGAKKRPFYRIVVADSRSPRDGRFIETHRHLRSDAAEGRPSASRSTPRRPRHWLAKGAQPTDRVLRFLDQAGVCQAPGAQQPEEGRARRQGQGARRRQGEGG